MNTLRISMAALALALAACGGNSNCKDACGKLQFCTLRSSGFSCSETCGGEDSKCAVCVNDKGCDEIARGKCSSACTKATFTK